jgi:hypothetical protein
MERKFIKEYLELAEYLWRHKDQRTDTLISWLELRKLSKRRYKNDAAWLVARSHLVDYLNYAVFPHLEYPIFLRVVHGKGVTMKIKKAAASDSMDREIQKVMRVTVTARKRARAASIKHPELKNTFDKLMLQYEQANLALFGSIVADDKLAKVVNVKALKRYI